jgi:hypothetical protein
MHGWYRILGNERPAVGRRDRESSGCFLIGAERKRFCGEWSENS